MMVERSKLRPVNLSKEDASKAIFRRSRWSSGFLNSRKKPKPKEEDDQEGNESHNEDHESDSEDEAAHNDSKCFSIDLKKLDKIEVDLVEKTKSKTIEELERIYTSLMECVMNYKHEYDRSSLPKEMSNRLISLKVF